MHPYHQTAALLFLVADGCTTSYLAAAFAPSTTAPASSVVDNDVASLLMLPRKEEEDLTQIGSLTVPSIGCGTIAWSTNKGKQAESESELTKNKIIAHE